jgi:hypothetical protein
MSAHSFLSSVQGNFFCATAVDAHSMKEAQITRAIFIIELSVALIIIALWFFDSMRHHASLAQTPCADVRRPENYFGCVVPGFCCCACWLARLRP